MDTSDFSKSRIWTLIYISVVYSFFMCFYQHKYQFTLKDGSIFNIIKIIMLYIKANHAEKKYAS